MVILEKAYLCLSQQLLTQQDELDKSYIGSIVRLPEDSHATEPWFQQGGKASLAVIKGEYINQVTSVGLAAK